jgi:hypothetical protein
MDMKKLFSLIVSVITFQVCALSTPTPHVISFFMVPCALNPACAKNFPNDKIGDVLGSHTEIAQEILKHHLASPLVQGIYASYLGYITYTDYNGQVILPNKESKDELTVVVTSQIYPVMLQGLTVHHFEIPHETDAHFYRYALVHDEKHKKSHWNISRMERPASSQVPDNALIILAKPQDIEIVPGTFEAHASPNFILPDIYVHTGIDTPFCVLKFVKINRFFEPLTLEKQYQEQSYSQAPLA